MGKIILTTVKKVIDSNSNKILKEDDVLMSLTYIDEQKIQTLYDVFVRLINRNYVYIDTDDYSTKIKITDIIAWN